MKQNEIAKDELNMTSSGEILLFQVNHFEY